MKVIRVMCTIQEGSLGYTKIKQLESSLKDIYKKHFGSGYKLVFMWLNLPYGQAYLAGKLSTASSVQLPVKDGMPSSKRHPFMSEVCQKWQDITGCTKDQIILASSDFKESDKFQQGLVNRFKPSKRKSTMLKMLLSFIKGRFKKGYYNTSITL